MKVRIDQRVLRSALLAFTALNLIIAGALWLWNPEPEIERRGNHDASTGLNVPSGGKPESAVDNSQIIGANIFSPARTPPSRRYNPSDDESMDAGGMPPEADISGMAASEPAPQLFGTVVGPAGAMALMQGDSADGPGRLRREGEKIGRYRLLKIKSNSVILSGPAGKMEIQVERNPTGAK